MDTPVIIAIAVAALLVLAALWLWGNRRKTRHLRVAATEHRDRAGELQAEADRKAAAAEQARMEAERARAEAIDLRTKADELDPDVDGDGTADGTERSLEAERAAPAI